LKKNGVYILIYEFGIDIYTSNLKVCWGGSMVPSFMLLFCVFCFVYFALFWDRVSLCSPGWPLTHSSASVSQELGLQVCTTIPNYVSCFYRHNIP
jgi:hypothetical protein